MSDNTALRKELWKKAWHSLIDAADPDFLNGLTISVLNGNTSPIQAWIVDPLENRGDKVPTLKTDADKLSLLRSVFREEPERVVGSPKTMLEINRLFEAAFALDEDTK